MEVLKEDGEGEPAERRRKLHSSDQTPADGQTKHTTWSQTVRWLQPWYSLAPVGVVWSVSQLEALLLHSSLSLGGVCWRMLLLCFLWIVLGGCIHALKCCLRPGRSQGEPLQRQQQEVVSENQHSQIFQSKSPSLHIPLILALADSLLLCVLQEPLPDPSVPYIQALLSRLESVFHTLKKAGIDSEVDPGSILTVKLKLLCTYLNQRIGTLRTLIKVQGDFEASVKDMLQGLDGLWAQLEGLHARVTLTKQGSQEQVAVASVQTDAESLFTVLGRDRKRLESCQAHLKDSTQVLQELTWSHTHTSNKVNSSMESVWPELLLQANIEQFDKVQESFHSLEQQTSTFQAHLEGLRKANQNGHTRPSSQAKDAHTETHVHNGSTSDVSLERCSSAASSVSSVEAEIEAETPLSLCERSALQFSSTFGRLRKSGRRK